MVERIPQTFIDDLTDRSDITEIIGKRVEIKKAGKEYKACCPFHNEKTPSFTISPEKGFYHCFGCGAHGTSLGFLMDYEKLTFVEAIEELAKILGMEVPKSTEDIKLTKKQTNLKSLLNEVSDYFQSNLKSNTKAIDHNGYVLGSNYYLASYTSGMRVIDIINIDQKSFTEIGFFDTHIDDHDHNHIRKTSNIWSDPGDHDGKKGQEIEAFNGAWSVYPFFKSENIIISDINSGLFIVKKKSN